MALPTVPDSRIYHPRKKKAFSCPPQFIKEYDTFLAHCAQKKYSVGGLPTILNPIKKFLTFLDNNGGLGIVPPKMAVEFAKEFLKLGLHISLGGPVTFLNGRVPKEVAKMVPFDKLLIETDAPYLSPHPFRGKTNEPARVKLVAEEIARLRDISYTEVAKKTAENAYKLFNIKELK